MPPRGHSRSQPDRGPAARLLAQVVGDVARLTRQAHTDSLTGLANRRELSVRLVDELGRAGRNAISLSFVICDIDDFKEINDGYGHQAGDEVIYAVASALSSDVRETDLPVRFGGEEFVIVFPGAPLADGRRAAMRKAIAELEVAAPRGGSIGLTASFGVAEFPTYSTPEALLGAADAALYQAKRAGKNRVARSTVHEEADADDSARAGEPAPALWRGVRHPPTAGGEVRCQTARHPAGASAGDDRQRERVVGPERLEVTFGRGLDVRRHQLVAAGPTEDQRPRRAGVLARRPEGQPRA